jgi:putative CocE/NonD family hydrolase
MRMQSQIQAIGLSWLVLLVTLIAILNVLEIRLRAQDYKPFNTASALAYITQHADREEKIRIPMRDGVRLSGLILFPKDFPRQNLPTVLFRSPYLIEPGEVGRFAQYLQSFLENGYAAIFENVRGRYFSEGTYTYLVGSGKDGYDTVDWITKQPWSNGKVGTLGCSSTAEEQHKLNGAQPPGLAATVPMASGAGIGRVGPYNEMGNFYRGGAFQNWWFSWYYKAGYTYRPLFPPNLSREALIRLGRFWNLEPETVPASNIDTLIWTLPINQIMDKMGAPPSDLDDFVNRLPNDPKWKNVDFAGEGDRFGAPMLMINSWYDLSIGPNIALFEYESKNAANETARNNMFMVIAPTTHCQQGYVESEHTIVGQRDMGDARFDYVRLVQQWFDHFLKGDENGVTNQPKVRAYMMGANQWRPYDRWPPKEVQYIAFYIDSDGGANSLAGNGRLTTSMPEKPGTDSFVYDPMYPVPSQGGNMATLSPSFQNGSVDQSNIEMRNDVLVYSTAPLKESVEIAGPVKVSMYLSSDAKDTDLTIKLIDVYPDGKAYNLDESIQRVRWRNGWEKPVFMQPGVVYKVDVGPLVTSNAFRPGHRIRIEVSSSNFPHFERNLNTGGNNFDEKQGVLAHNVIYHSPTYPSMVVLPLLPAGNRHYPATTE